MVLLISLNDVVLEYNLGSYVGKCFNIHYLVSWRRIEQRKQNLHEAAECTYILMSQIKLLA